MRRFALLSLLPLGSLTVALAVALVVTLLGRPAAAQPVPELVRLQRAAIRTAGLAEGRFRALRARQHLAPLLPQVHASLGWGLQKAYASPDGAGAAPSSSAAVIYAARDSQRQTASIGASWDLSRLLYSRDDLTLLQHEQRAAAARAALSTQIARLYLERRRLLAGPLDARHHERLVIVTATLSALTGVPEAGMAPATSGVPANSANSANSAKPANLAYPRDRANPANPEDRANLADPEDPADPTREDAAE